MARKKRSASKKEDEEEEKEEEFSETEENSNDDGGLKELAELVEKLNRSSTSATTAVATSKDTADVVVGTIGLSYTEFKELITRVNGFSGSLTMLLVSIPPKLRQALTTLYRYAVVYYDPSISVWRVDFLRLRQRVKVLRTSVEVQRFYLPRQPVAQSVAPTTQLQQAKLVEEIIKAAEAGEELEEESKEKTSRKFRLTKPITYPGGDWPLKDTIIDLLVESGCTTLVEVFGGSGVISMYAPRDVFKNIVYNDIDKLLVNFFTVLRERPRELMERVMQMPVARELVEKYVDMIKTGEIHKIQDPVEKAAIYFYVNRLTFNSELQSFKVLVGGSAAKRFRNQAILLPEYAKMWSDVTIENKDFRELIELYDRPYTVFYCDPPFLTVEWATKGEREKYYLHSFTEQDMKDLLKILSSVEGKFVLKLPQDHLEIPFIRSWVEKHSYSIKVVEHAKQMVNVKGGKREKQKTVFVYNYST
ncbi:MAG: DNA adenine methylase [Desulfurococcaceae archaeon]|nr:DNA adenine methylase [Desulfurococcaceae archaeon]